jgi:hypothetical protein
VNVRDAAWVTNEAFGARCLFEADVSVLRERPDLEPQRFQQLGIKLAVFDPGQPSEAEERRLRQWDFLHCATGPITASSARATGRASCLMVGSRVASRTFDYPEQGAKSSQEAYLGYPHWRPGPRPDAFG